MKAAILQSNYIPWKGYFDIIGSVDLFVFYDDRQYTTRDWRNRNKIKLPRGADWLTVPCGSSRNRLICEVQLQDSGWQKQHWELIRDTYSKAPHFREFAPFFEALYLERTWTNLSEMNQFFIKAICREIFDIKTEFRDSREYALKESKGDRIMELLLQLGATAYLSGPSAKDYLEESAFQEAGIELEWMDYGSYEEYPQLHPPFSHYVSIVDLIFNTGPDAKKFMLFPKAE